MSITLTLPSELENQLMTEATQVGLSLAQYIQQRLSIRKTAESQPRTGLELVAYWQTEGLFGSRPEISDSQCHARTLRAQVENRTDG
jgi:hypothetical protein